MDAYLWTQKRQGPPVPLSVGPSPYVYQNVTSLLQLVQVSGGAVALIEIDAGAGFLPAIGVAGLFTLFPSQQIRVTYVAVAPTMTTIQIL